jgi:MerR family transcriptional regulator, thiopeptide resistance regulator
MHKVSEFAEKVGVTVRTLHHYDRLRLLRPGGRTRSGYRLYGETELARLQQIATLKFLGVPLKTIKALLDRGSLELELDLAATLGLQRRLLTEKRRQIDLALQAIELAERSSGSRRSPDWQALKTIIEVMEMQDNNMEWTKKYYSEEAQAKIAERAKTWTPELQAEVSQQWKELVSEIESAIAAGEDPAGAKAQTLARRCSELVRGFTGGDPEIQKGVNKLYSDQKIWPPNFQKPFSDEVQAFITKAIAAGRRAKGNQK